MAFHTKYRYQDLKPGDAYYERWQQIRFLPLLFPVVIAGAVLVVYVPQKFDYSYDLPSPFAWFALVMFLLPFGTLWLLSRVQCPRCKTRFFVISGGLSISPLIAACPHCHLPKWAPDDPEKPRQP